MKNIIRIGILCLITMSMGAVASAATFVVNTTNDTVDATPGDGNCADASAACSLRAAISEANALAGDDIITLPAGTYTQSLVAANDNANAGGDWDITGNLTINGAGSATTIMQAAATSGTATERVLNVRSGTTIVNGVTIRNGRFTGTMTTETRGGGIENLGTLTLNNSIVRDNQVSSTSGNPIGGGIHNAGPALSLINTTVTANSCLRPASTGSAFGGGVDSIVAATITITNSSISGNNANSPTGFGFGAGLYLENIFVLNATNSNFDNNTGGGSSGSNGTGVRALSATGAAVFNATNCTFNGNSGTGGLNQGQALQLFTVTSAAATLTATFDGVTINGNTGNSLGVGVNVTANGGPVNITFLKSTISNNTGATNGGGVHVTNTGSTLSSSATVNFTNSTVSGNTATGNGGGVSVEQPAAGGTVTANFNFATVANNTATTSGGGIFRSTAGTVNLKNTIVADNTSATGPDLAGTINSQDYNHIENLTGATITGTTTNNGTGDPQLGALALNGGTTQNHLPGGSSPVINTIPNGTNDCGTTITTDQRGQTRPGGAGCEKGSVEVAAAAVFANIGGQALTADGRGIRNVTVTVSGGGLSQPLVTQTGSLGYYNFSNLTVGQTYTVTVTAKRFTFATSSQNVTLAANATLNFTANAGPGLRPIEITDSIGQ